MRSDFDTVQKGAIKMIKRYFFTGLALLLPVVFTIWIVSFFINLLTRPFLNIVKEILRYYNLLDQPFLFLSADQFLHLVSKVLIILILIGVTLLLGFLTKVFVMNTLIKMGDKIIHKIPIVNRIYKAAQDVVQTLLKKERQSFSQVVLVPFPCARSYSIGMVTRECLNEDSDEEHAGLISVFVPATPNPTMGFMLFFKREQLVFVDMKVEDALRTVMSCGVIFNKPNEILQDEHPISEDNR
ncbi:conserved hypothetical protein [Waddlia chondrophila WSU 86-1044]|uniref:DUF502 domain-containing protein n=2 Tax=Waddlia chondrophila TaxID=71667 RepID=D6YW91_WADCW|nr:conserved hypothetical protein [Waddlia chondrophila WSU 86-1044]